MKKINNISWLRIVSATMSLLLVALFTVSCGDNNKKGESGAADVGAPRGKESFQDIVKRRGLNEDDVLAAVKTYTPDNIKDEAIVANSGGQEGNLPTYVAPSMRMVKYVPINTRQPYAGFGYSEETMDILEDGYRWTRNSLGRYTPPGFLLKTRMRLWWQWVGYKLVRIIHVCLWVECGWLLNQTGS